MAAKIHVARGFHNDLLLMSINKKQITEHR